MHFEEKSNSLGFDFDWTQKKPCRYEQHFRTPKSIADEFNKQLTHQKNMIIVTGGTSGIGHEIIRTLRGAGENVITLSRRELTEDKNHISHDLTTIVVLKEHKLLSSRAKKYML